MIEQRTIQCRMWPGCGCMMDGRGIECCDRETITIPPGNSTVRVCAAWPDCGCRGDCEDCIVLGRPQTPRRILFACLLVIALAGCGLIWLGLRPG